MRNDAISAQMAAAGAIQALRLDKLDAARRIDSGFVDLFVVEVDSADRCGARHHIARLEPGRCLFALPLGRVEAQPARAHTLLAVPSLDARLEAVDAGSAHSLHARFLLDLVASLCPPAPAWTQIRAGAGARLLLTGGQIAHAATAPVWARLESGSARTSVLGVPLSPGALVPMCVALGLHAVNECRIEVRAQPDWPGYEAGARFETAHRVIATALAARLATDRSLQHRRLLGRRRAGQSGMASAMRQLAALASGRPRLRHTVAMGSGRDAALAIVLEELGLESAGQQRSAPASELRSVRLRGNWWSRDNGPLLVSDVDGERWYALLPRFDTLTGEISYRRVDPAGADLATLDASSAAALAQEAFVAYRRLPVGIKRARELARFAFSASGGDVMRISVMGLCSGLLAMAAPLATGLIFNDIIARSELTELPALVLGLVLAALGASAFDTVRAIAVVRVEGRMGAALQPAVMRQLMALPIGEFRTAGRGELAARVLGVERILQLMSGTVMTSLLAGLFSLTSLLVIAFYSVSLALLALGLVLVAGLSTLLLGRLQLGYERAAASARGRENGLLVQATEGIGKIRTTQSESRLYALWAELFGRHQLAMFRAQRISNLRQIFTGGYGTLAYIALFALASTLVFGSSAGRAPGLSLGDFLASYSAFGQLLAATLALSSAMAAALEAIPQYERLRPIVEGIPESTGRAAEVMRLDGAIEVNHVSFRYQTGAPLVIDGLSLVIEPGSFTGIVGASGSGKTTLVRLLLGLDTPEQGEVLYQGRSLATLDLASLRRRIGVVLQSGRLQTGSVFDNISGAPGGSGERHRSHAHGHAYPCDRGRLGPVGRPDPAHPDCACPDHPARYPAV
jgi:ABC-type bacteriocin/lantibiotic exporter with double-glycine peptidase domain